jgi:hypothetical protein
MRFNNNMAEASSSYHQVLFCSQMGGELAAPVNVADILKCGLL